MKILISIVLFGLFSSGCTKDVSTKKMPGVPKVNNTDTTSNNPIVSRSCLVQPLHSTGGNQPTADNGASWGACTSFICDTGYTEKSGQCLPFALTATINNTIENSSGYHSFFTNADNIVSGSCIPGLTVTLKTTYNNLANTLFSDSVLCPGNGLYTFTLLRSAVSHLPFDTYNNYVLTLTQGTNNVATVTFPLIKQTTTKPCVISNGTGSQSYIGSGSYSSCNLVSCNASYVNLSGICTLANQTRSCLSQPLNSNGGLEVSNDGGLSWGSCSSFSCNASYTNISGNCVLSNASRSCTSQPANSSGGLEYSTNGGATYGSCSGFSCNASYTNVSGICVASSQTRSCVSQPSNSTGGTESTSNGGVTWAACSGYSCSTNYTNVAGMCVLTTQSRSCTIQPSNSSGGTETTTNGGTLWGFCSGFSCNSNYTNVSGSCVLSSQARSCSIQPSNSTGGTESTTDGGSTWGSCSGWSCNVNYTNVSGTCTLSSQTRACASQPSNSTGGTQSSTDGGQTWGSCDSFTCDSSYVKQTSTQNQSISSSINLSLERLEDYGTSYKYHLRLYNTTASPISGWKMCFNYNYVAGDSGTLWGHTITANNFEYTAIPTGATSTIPVGDYMSVGWVGDGLPNGAMLNSIRLVGQSDSCGSATTSIASSSQTCVAANQNRSCVLQPLNSTGGTESTTNGGVSWRTCENFTCSAGYEKSADGFNCDYKTYTVQVNKLTNQGSVTDTSLGKISCGNSCTTETQTYDSGSMIVLDAVPAAGYTITGWTGCDSTSLSNTRCTVSSLAGNRVISPVFVASYLSLAVVWNDDAFGDVAGATLITKNGASCTTRLCLDNLIIGDAIEITIDPGTYLKDTLSFSTTGSPVNFSANTNIATFNMGSSNVVITANMEDKDVVINNNNFATIDSVSGTLDSYATSSSSTAFTEYVSQTDLKFKFNTSATNMTNNRSVIMYSGLACGGIRIIDTIDTMVSSNSSYPFTAIANSSTYYSYQVQNVYKLSPCYSQKIHHITSPFSKTTETIIANSAIEGSNGYPSFFTDTSNTVSGVCKNSTELGNPVTYSYNYGLIEGSFPNITIEAQAFSNSNLTTPFYTNSQTTSCSGAGVYSSTVPYNANFATADVIKYKITFKNLFGAIYTETISANKEKSSKACTASNASSANSSYLSNGTYDTCTIVSCDSGYTHTGNTCVSSTISRACYVSSEGSTVGSQSSTDGGNTWGSCTGWTCESGYFSTGSTCESLIIGTVDEFSTNTDNSCVINNSGILYCWGWNGEGTNGNGGQVTDETSVPTLLNSNLLLGRIVTQVSVGQNHACAVTDDGNAYCWGNNSNGQLGDNSTIASSIPVQVNTAGALAGKNVVHIEAGSNFTCALTSDKKVFCWGLNSSGQLGNMSTTQSLVPVSIDLTGVLAGKNILQITSGTYATCVIADDYLGYCWGGNASKELGANLTTAIKTYPVAVYTGGVLSGKTLRTITGHNNESFCAITNDNLAYCWGNGTDGQLGNSTWANSKVPVAVSTGGVLNGVTIKSIYTSYHSTCAIKSNNTMACWGKNGNGQLGDGTTNASALPVNVDMTGALSGKNLVSATGGWLNSCVKTTENKYYCWGWNNAGHFGNGDEVEAHSPVQAMSLFSF